MASFPSIRIEGGLFGPDFLDQIARGEVSGQKPTDFGLETRRNITDEIAAAFADARAYWEAFNNRLDRLPEEDLATTLTRKGWIEPFFNTILKYSTATNKKAYDVGGLSFAISHRAADHEDALPVHIVGYRQDLGRVPESGRPRLSPHALLQEFLNRHEHLWGIVTNGKTLRILRDSTFIRRQAYLEFDLTAIFEEQRFEDFAILYRLIHRSRLPHAQADGDQCLLEQYYNASQAEGGRVREHLRDGVEECLLKLANGFLNHPSNQQLRDDISQGNYLAEKMYQHLLRIVYRLLFLIVSEDRRLLTSNPVYTDHYSIARLRRLVQLPAAHTRDADLYHSLQVLWQLLRDDTAQKDGKPLASVLDLPVLNGELFASLKPVSLDDYLIDNHQLLDAIEHLTYWRPKPSEPPRRVNYAALDVEELGSVYESLLELHPEIHVDTRGLPQFLLPKGAGRKETGSYYTPPSLVNELIHSALEPVIEERLNIAKVLDRDGDTTAQQKAILNIKVIDPACGSGHMILAAARRLGKELARLRTGEDEPAPERNREAIRDVISHCIYGVDKNPLAVDLCRVALWLESHTSGKPLTFLDHRIRHGDSLVGVFDLQVLTDGIPQEAYKALEGDDKNTAKTLAARNKEELKGLDDLFGFSTTEVVQELQESSLAVDALPDDSPELIRRKKQLHEQGRKNPNWLRKKEACDLWTAAFFAEKTSRMASENRIPTSMVVSDHLSQRSVDNRYLATARMLAFRNDFFHWPLEFPEIFSRGGFDVVLSNPPWERIKLQEQEFFAVRDTDIAEASNAAVRKRMIAKLPEGKPELYKEYLRALRSAAGASSILRNGNRYPLAGRGDINLYAVFAELGRTLVNQQGRAGLIVPTGIATDDTTKHFFQDVIYRNCLISLFDFENRKKLFPAVDSRMKFCLFTVAGCDLKKPVPSSPDSTRQAKFVFYAQEPDDLRKSDKVFTLTPEDIQLLNPNTGNCPIFRSKADAELTKLIYRRVTVLWDETKNNSYYKIRLMRVLDMNKSATLAQCLPADQASAQDMLPVYEGKLLHQYDHRFASYPTPQENPETFDKHGSTIGVRWLVNDSFVRSLVSTAMTELFQTLTQEPEILLVYRDFTNTTNERTCIATVVPFTGTDFTLRVLFTTASAIERASLLACLNSLAFDYCARQKTAGTHLSDYIMKQLPIPQGPQLVSAQVTYFGDAGAFARRVLELCYTTEDLAPFAADLGYTGPPFPWYEDRRFQIRCELDALFFHLYLGTPEDWNYEPKELRSAFLTPRHAVDYIMDTFPIVKRKDEEAHGTYRTKDKILEIYDAMEQARRSGTPWESPLTFPELNLSAEPVGSSVKGVEKPGSTNDLNDDDSKEDDSGDYADETVDTDELDDDDTETDPVDEKTEARIRQYNSIDDYHTEDLMYAIRRVYTEQGSRQGYSREEGLQALRKALHIGSLGSNIRYGLENAIITAQKRGIIIFYDHTGVHSIWRRSLKDYITEPPDPYHFLRKYLRAALGTSAWQEEAQAITATTRYLGFARTTEQMAKILKSTINSAIRRGRIERDGSRIRRV